MTEIYKKKFIWEVSALNDKKEELYKGFAKISARPNLTTGKATWQDVYIALKKCDENTKKLHKTKYVKLRLLTTKKEPLEEWISGEGEIQIKESENSLELHFKCQDWSYNNPV